MVSLKSKDSMCFCLLVAVISLLTVVGGAAGVEFQGIEHVSVNEDVGSLQLTLSRTESSPVTVLVRIMTLDQFAARDTSVSGTCEEDLTIVGLDPAEDSDFSAREENVEFEADSRLKQINIDITSDLIAEPTESFAVVIDSSATGNCALLVNITDDDIVRFKFNVFSINAIVNASVFSFDEVRLLKLGSHESDITFSIQILEESTADIDNDFRLLKASYTFSNDDKDLVVPIEVVDSDNVTEEVENITLCLPSVFEGVTMNIMRDSPACVTISLVDDDGDILVGFPEKASSVIPHFEVIEGRERQICIGIIGGAMHSKISVFEIGISLRRNDSGTENRLGTEGFQTPLDPFFVGSPAVTLQLNPQFLQQDCFNANASDNNIIDGHAFYIIDLNVTGNTAVNNLPVRVVTPQATLSVLDNDFTTLRISLDTAEEPFTAREGMSTDVPLAIDRSGDITSLTYLLTLGTQPAHMSDFNFSTIVLEPSNVHNSAISFQIINDLIPEARKEYTIFIEDVNLADEREGALPVTNGNISIQLYDNDFAVGFGMQSPVVLEEGSSISMSLSILQPSGSSIDPMASLPLSLVVRRMDDPQGQTYLMVNATNVVLSQDNPTVVIELSATNDHMCAGVNYVLSYEYTGSNHYSIISGQDGSVTVQVMDDNCATTTVDARSTTDIVVSTTDTGKSTTVVSTTDTGKSTTVVSTTDTGKSTTVVSTTDAGNSTTDAVGQGGEYEDESSLCVLCIVIPILILLLIILCLIILICCLCCYKRFCWHTYDAKKREEKFGEDRNNYM